MERQRDTVGGDNAYEIFHNFFHMAKYVEDIDWYLKKEDISDEQKMKEIKEIVDEAIDAYSEYFNWGKLTPEQIQEWKESQEQKDLTSNQD